MAAIESIVLRRSILVLKRSRKPEPDCIAISTSRASFISANSCSTDQPAGLSQSSDFFALSALPFCKSQRGDSGMKKRPMAIIPGTT